MVNGATNYVASLNIKRSLEDRLTQGATIMDLLNARKLQHLTELAIQPEGEITYFKAYLHDEVSCMAAIQHYHYSPNY